MEVANGTVEGTAASISIDVGFTPTWVRLINIDGDAVLDWTDDMGAGTGYKLVAAGTNAFVSTGGVTQATADDGVIGFKIGTDADINASAETIIWLAGR